MRLLHIRQPNRISDVERKVTENNATMSAIPAKVKRLEDQGRDTDHEVDLQLHDKAKESLSPHEWSLEASIIDLSCRSTYINLISSEGGTEDKDTQYQLLAFLYYGSGIHDVSAARKRSHRLSNTSYRVRERHERVSFSFQSRAKLSYDERIYIPGICEVFNFKTGTFWKILPAYDTVFFLGKLVVCPCGV